MTDSDIETSQDIRRLITAARALVRHCDQAPLVWLGLLQQPLPPALRGGSDPVSTRLAGLADFDPWADLAVTGVDSQTRHPAAADSVRQRAARRISSPAVGEPKQPGGLGDQRHTGEPGLAKMRDLVSPARAASPARNDADNCKPAVLNSSRARDAAEFRRHPPERPVCRNRETSVASRPRPGLAVKPSGSDPITRLDGKASPLDNLATRRLAIAREGFDDGKFNGGKFSGGKKPADKSGQESIATAFTGTQSRFQSRDQYADSPAASTATPLAQSLTQQGKSQPPKSDAGRHVARPPKPLRVSPRSLQVNSAQAESASHRDEADTTAGSRQGRALEEIPELKRREDESSGRESSAPDRRPASLAADDLARELVEAACRHGIDLT